MYLVVQVMQLVQYVCLDSNFWTKWLLTETSGMVVYLSIKFEDLGHKVKVYSYTSYKSATTAGIAYPGNNRQNHKWKFSTSNTSSLLPCQQ